MKPKPSGPRIKRPAVSPEEREAFLQAVGDVKPLGARDRVALPPRPPSPVRVVELPPEVTLTPEVEGSRYAARAPGVSRTQLSELRAGKVRAEATLDLHGKTIERGTAELRQFLFEARDLGRRCILIIHGKGLHSEQGAPLRDAVISELLGSLSGLVQAFASAAPADGGEGATYVMMKGHR